MSQSSPNLYKNSENKSQIFNLLAEELCSMNPNKSKIKKLCTEGKIIYSGDMVDLMSTVLFELSELNRHKSSQKLGQ